MLVGPQQRQLDHVGRVEFPAEPRVQLQAGEQPQVLAVLLQGTPAGLCFSGHRPPKRKDAGKDESNRAGVKKIRSEGSFPSWVKVYYGPSAAGRKPGSFGSGGRGG